MTRNNLAHWMAKAGATRQALELFRSLVADYGRVLGRDHPNTLKARGNLAIWTAKTGDKQESLRVLKELMRDQERVLGKHHPDTLLTQNNFAQTTGEARNKREALRLFTELLPERIRVLGADHPDTLTTRNNIAHWTGETGDKEEALRLFQELLPDTERVQGPEHPDTLRARNNLACTLAATGNVVQGGRLLEELLPVQERVLGPRHAETLLTVKNLGRLRRSSDYFARFPFAFGAISVLYSLVFGLMVLRPEDFATSRTVALINVLLVLCFLLGGVGVIWRKTWGGSMLVWASYFVLGRMFFSIWQTFNFLGGVPPMFMLVGISIMAGITGSWPLFLVIWAWRSAAGKIASTK